MKLLRIAVLSGCVGLLAFAAGCNRDTERKQPSEDAKPLVFGKKKKGEDAKPDPRIEIVQPAVDKGVAFLKQQVRKIQSMRPAYAGLAGLALLEGGLQPDDPDILKIAETIRKAAPKMAATYDLAASLFFLNRWHEASELSKNDRDMARTLCLRIIAGQTASGIWGYRGVMMGPEAETNLLASLKDGSYKPGPGGPGPVSMSNTQFAMLAVWGSHKHGVPVREPLLALAGYFHENQLENGRWIYPKNSLAATSTCAGLISLAVERVLLNDPDFASGQPNPMRKKKADVDKAFAFVGKTVGRNLKDPGAPRGYGGKIFNADAGGDLYFLWTLERVGVIYSRENIGERDWYDWGYPIVLKEQHPDGSWNEGAPTLGGGPLIDTCFAILFLKRTNIAKDLTDKLQLLSLGPPPNLFWHDPRPRRA